jgi:hypothetical protein
MSSDIESGLYDQRKIVEELHTHTRANMQMWVQWFTFFITVNYLGFGWFLQKTPDSNPPSRTALIAIASLLGLQCFLGVWVTLYFRRWLGKTHNNLMTAYKSLSHPVTLPFSLHFYQRCLELAAIALVSMIVAWAWLAWHR